jgi:hypothetical protein
MRSQLRQQIQAVSNFIYLAAVPNIIFNPFKMVFPKDFPICIPYFKDASIIWPGIILVFSMIIGPLFIIEPVVKNITFQERFHRHSFMHELTNVLFEQKGRDPVVLISRDVIDYYVYGLDLVVS